MWRLLILTIKYHGYRAQTLRSRKADRVILHKFRIGHVPHRTEITHAKQKHLILWQICCSCKRTALYQSREVPQLPATRNNSECSQSRWSSRSTVCLYQKAKSLNLSNTDEFGASFAVLLISTELPKNPEPRRIFYLTTWLLWTACCTAQVLKVLSKAYSFLDLKVPSGHRLIYMAMRCFITRKFKDKIIHIKVQNQQLYLSFWKGNPSCQLVGLSKLQLVLFLHWQATVVQLLLETLSLAYLSQLVRAHFHHQLPHLLVQGQVEETQR